MALENAQLYLARALPWPQDGDPPAFVNIHWTFEPSNHKLGAKFPWTGRAVRDLKEAVNAIDWAIRQPGTRDVYACLSTQLNANEKTGKNNFKYFTPIRGQANAVAIKTLFLDVDFKGGASGYDTQNEAVHELARFLKETSLPKPSMLIMSGGGVHVYWTLARALTLGEWQPLAYALAEATKKHALKCDTQCTVDGARVLRVPDTWNRKLDTPRPVTLAGGAEGDYSVEHLAKLLAPYKTTVPKLQLGSASLFAGFQVSASVVAKFKIENDLAAGLEKEYAPIMLDDVGKECAFIGVALATGGKDYTQPLWNLTTLLSTFTADGRVGAHRMGDKHPGYTKDSTDEMFDRKDRERVEKSLGWPSCTSISAAGCTACQTCRHFPSGKTPIHPVVSAVVGASTKPVAGAVGAPDTSVGAGQLQTAAPVAAIYTAAGDLPKDYVRGSDGIIKQVVVGEDGSAEFFPICDSSLEYPWLQTNPNILNWTSRIEGGVPQKIHINLECVGTQEMRKFLQKQGFMLPHGDKATQRISVFMNSWIKQLRDTRASVSTAPFGWNDKGSIIDGFVFGGHVWTDRGDSPAAASEPELRRQYDPVGSVTPWVTAAKMITDQGRPALDAVLATSFGAPLVMWTGEAGVVMSAYSKESGIGKSTALKVAQAVWGDPITAMQSLDDTKNFAMGKLGRIRHLPMYWDEIKSEAQTRKLVEIIFETSGGKEKGRMGRDTTLREPGQWKTLFLAASNDSLLDHVMKHTPTTTAGLYRVFEYVVPPPSAHAAGQLVPSEAALMVSELDRNHGAVGLEYAKFLGLYQATIKIQMKEMLDHLHHEVSSHADERFWMVAIAAALLGARYANHLGFISIDEVALKKFLLGVLVEMRSHIKEQPVDLSQEFNLSNVVAGFLGAARGKHLVFTNKIHVGRGKPPKDSVRVDGNRCDPGKIDEIWVQVGVDDGLMRLSHGALKMWLDGMKLSHTLVIRGVMDEYKAKRMQGRMASGTKFLGGGEYLFEIDLAHAPNLDIRY
jgi:hypothetical protein